MRRTTFDTLMTTAGLALAAVLLIAGVLLSWGYSFANGQVHDQLAAQKIVFPTKGSAALTSLPAADRKAMSAYAGQQLVNGAQAEVYADHFIAVHLREIGGGKTYAQLSSEAQAHPNNAALAGQVEAVFKGTTLRGMLLNAYAFWKLGQIALIAAVASYCGAVVMLVLCGLGLVHRRRTAPEAEVFTGHRHTAPEPA